MILNALPAGISLPQTPATISLEEASPYIAGVPKRWPCPVCGVVPDEAEQLSAILEVTYTDGGRDDFLVVAHRACLSS
jgi:hypothetical protein